MHRFLLAAAALASFSVASIPPAFAMKGIDAARSCVAQKGRCTAVFDEAGGVTIIVDGYIFDCPSPQQECNVVGTPSRVKTNGVVTPGFAGMLPGLSR